MAVIFSVNDTSKLGSVFEAGEVQSRQKNDYFAAASVFQTES